MDVSIVVTTGMRALAATALALAAIAACSSGDGAGSAGGASDDACVSVLLGADRSACVECLRSTCPSGLDALETGCGAMLGCVCPAGATGGAAARVQGCGAAVETPSCQQGTASYATGVCGACDVACDQLGAAGGSTSSSGGVSNGSSGTGSSGTGSSGDTGSSGSAGSSSGSSSSGGTSGSGSGAGSSSSGSSCEDLTGCDTQCSTDYWQCSNGPGRFCMSSQCMCFDTCYFTVGSQVFPCASCSDYGDCESAAIAACQ